jgi:tRNA pseudouridine32 synthase/23S rRNA pseudouridine746 synthase
MQQMLRPRLLKASPDGCVLAVHKPPGIPFHSLGAGSPGLLSILRSDPSILAGFHGGSGTAASGPAVAAHQPPQRLFAVHRLDTATSGIVLFATSSHVAGLVARAFRERRVHKIYVALSARKPKKKQGSVIGEMRRGRRSTWMLLPNKPSKPPHSSSSSSSSSVEPPPRDPAVTRFWSTSLPEVQPGLRLYLLKPETGGLTAVACMCSAD